VIALRNDQIRRMRRMDVLPSFQLTFVDSTWKADLRRTFGPDRYALLGRWRDLVEDPRLHAIGSTDTPYGEGFDLRPTTVMAALAQATTRIGEPGGRPPEYMREQRLTLTQALHALTTGGAYGIFAEDELGATSRCCRPRRPEDLDVLRSSRTHGVEMVFGGRSRSAPWLRAALP
jgi:predicted amidohydrolase YtcJ